MLTSTGARVNARRSSTEWNDVSSCSLRITAATASPSESSSPVSRKRGRLGAAGTSLGTAGSTIRNCSPLRRCSMSSASWASWYRLSSDW